jgi:deoxyribonuclease-4
MPLLGTHVSVAGGLPLAVARAEALGCAAFQIFSRNANRWAAPPLDPVGVHAFRTARDRCEMATAVSHGSYLVNLAAPAGSLRDQSVAALADELARAETLGLLGVVLHPGSGGEAPEEIALERAGDALRTVLKSTTRSPTMILLEHTAGQGRSVGHRFEHLAALIGSVDGSPRVGVCLDTCHLLAAGYDIATANGYRRTFDDFDRMVGLDRLRVFHVNDSKKPCGSRVDRHAHIGEGHVGIDGFARLLNDRRFERLPMLLETKKNPLRRARDTAPDALDRMNMDRLRGLVSQGCGSPEP